MADRSRPVLTEEFLRASSPSMRTPLPPFQPPPPPFSSPSTDPLSTLATDEDDDSQYETPDPHVGSRPSGSFRPGRASHHPEERSALISELPYAPGNPTMKAVNSYRQTPSLHIEEERHQLIKQNPQNGSYFIPNLCEFLSSNVF